LHRPPARGAAPPPCRAQKPPACCSKLAGLRLTVKSAEKVPPGQCVIVANHASYLDGVVFTAVLPPRFGFIIKREMDRVPLAGLLLRRLGSLFVERANRQRGANDARRVLRTALNGSSLVFFPEGTFSPAPGLLKFHVGAFTTAVRVGCPIIPAVIRGTRKVFPLGLFSRDVRTFEVEFLARSWPRRRAARTPPSTYAIARAWRSSPVCRNRISLPRKALTCCVGIGRRLRRARGISGRASTL